MALLRPASKTGEGIRSHPPGGDERQPKEPTDHRRVRQDFRPRLHIRTRPRMEAKQQTPAPVKGRRISRAKDNSDPGSPVPGWLRAGSRRDRRRSKCALTAAQAEDNDLFPYAMQMLPNESWEEITRVDPARA